MAPMSSPKPKVGAGSIASRWRELHGSGSWAKLVDPLDSDLRASIIAYGEHAEAAYDGFNADENSPEAGSCLYSSAGLLAASGVSHPEYYTVTKFLYATCDLRHVPESSAAMLYFVRPVAPLREGPWWRQSNWTGYVAVATDEGAAALGRRDILVAWRGTVEKLEMIKDIIWASVSAEPVLGLSTFGKFPDATVHGGFLSVYSAKMDERSTTMQEENKTSAGEQALREVRRLMEVHKDEETSITVTGHSLGATLATFNAVDMVANGVNVCPSPSGGPAASSCPVTAILFACPKVGNATFKAALSSFPDLRALHVKNAYDIVPMYPSVDFGYVVDAATVTLAIDTDRSPYLRTRSFMTPIDDVLRAHNLECYLHALAGDQGAGKDFKLVVNRDVALVNKGTDSLKDDYPVPANWWVPNSKYRYKVMGVARFMLHNFNQEEAQE